MFTASLLRFVTWMHFVTSNTIFIEFESWLTRACEWFGFLVLFLLFLFLVNYWFLVTNLGTTTFGLLVTGMNLFARLSIFLQFEILRWSAGTMVLPFCILYTLMTASSVVSLAWMN